MASSWPPRSIFLLLALVMLAWGPGISLSLLGSDSSSSRSLMASADNDDASFAYVSFSYRALQGESEGRPISSVKISCTDLDSSPRASFEPFEHVLDTWVFALPHGNFSCTTAAVGHYTLRFGVIISERDAAHSISISQNFYLLPLQHGLRMFTLWQLRERHVRIEPRLSVIFPLETFMDSQGLGLAPLSPSSHSEASTTSMTQMSGQEKDGIAHLKEKLGEEITTRFSELDANSSNSEGPKHLFGRGVPQPWIYYTNSEAGYGADVISMENGLPGLYRLSIELKQGSFEDAEFTFFIVGGMDDEVGIKYTSSSHGNSKSPIGDLVTSPSSSSSSSPQNDPSSLSSTSKMPSKSKTSPSSSATFFWHIADLSVSLLGNQCTQSILTTANYFGSNYGDFQPLEETRKGETKEIHFECEHFDSRDTQDCLAPVFEYDTAAKTCSVWGSAHILNFEHEMVSTSNLTFLSDESNSIKGGIVTLISNQHFSIYATLIGEETSEKEQENINDKENGDSVLQSSNPSSNQTDPASSTSMPITLLSPPRHTSHLSVFDVTLRLHSVCNPFSWSLYSLSPGLVNFPSAGNYRLRFDEKTKEFKVDALRLSISVRSLLIDEDDSTLPHQLKRRLVGVTISLPKDLSDLSSGHCTAHPHQPELSGDDSWEYDEYREEEMERPDDEEGGEEEEKRKNHLDAHYDSAAEPTVPEPLDDNKCRVLTGMKLGSAWHATCTEDMKHKSSAEFSELTASIASFDHNYNANTYVFTTELISTPLPSFKSKNKEEKGEKDKVKANDSNLDRVDQGKRFLQQRKPLEVVALESSSISSQSYQSSQPQARSNQPLSSSQSSQTLSSQSAQTLSSQSSQTLSSQSAQTLSSQSSQTLSSQSSQTLSSQSPSTSSSPSSPNPDSLIEPTEDSTPTPLESAILKAMEMQEYSRM